MRTTEMMPEENGPRLQDNPERRSWDSSWTLLNLRHKYSLCRRGWGAYCIVVAVPGTEVFLEVTSELKDKV